MLVTACEARRPPEDDTGRGQPVCGYPALLAALASVESRRETRARRGRIARLRAGSDSVNAGRSSTWTRWA